MKLLTKNPKFKNPINIVAKSPILIGIKNANTKDIQKR